MEKMYGVIGCPIGHSMSPFIQKELFKLWGQNAGYEGIEIPSEKLEEKFGFLKTLCGFNVTLPHKTEIIRLLDDIDVSAAEYGAVNTVKVEGGKTVGYNTDAYGFLQGLKLAGIPLRGKVLVYGFGGAAKTVIVESVKAGCEVTVCTTKERQVRAENTARKLHLKLGKEIKVINDEEIQTEYDLFINASPVGMYPEVGRSPISADKVDLFAYVFDLVYNPENTELIKIAKSKNKTCASGLSMLVFQAVLAQKIWNGAEFTEEQILKVIGCTSEEQKEVFGR